MKLLQENDNTNIFYKSKFGTSCTQWPMLFVNINDSVWNLVLSL